jgi:GNAT superfamily N-acetyltransferase
VRVVIRPVFADDEPRWRELWDSYTRFYEREPEESLTRHTWSRILDSAAPIHAIVAESEEHGVVGIANYVVHESTSTPAPVCYLQDLFVDPTVRAHGVGRQMLEWLFVEAATRNWSRLYWQTKEDNYRARALYDRFTPHSGFVRYVLTVPSIV